MPASLRVDLNGSELHDIDAPPEFTVSGPFIVELVNHGEAVHVHLHLDDDLSRVARLRAGNHYVEADTSRPIRVDTRAVDEPRGGKLEIVTGYGAETHYVDVTVEPGATRKESVEVDEALSKPRQPAPPTSPLAPVHVAVDETALPVLLLGVFAIALALGVGLLADSAAVLATAAVVVLGVLVAVVLLFR